MAVGGYFIGGYWLLVILSLGLLVVINDYSINGYWWTLLVINGYWWLNYHWLLVAIILMVLMVKLSLDI
jgi:hypothetical protein